MPAECVAALSPLGRAAVVSGGIFALQAFRILLHAHGFGLVRGLGANLVASLFPVLVVSVWSSRRRVTWSWLRVIAVVLLSRVGLGIFFLGVSWGLFLATHAHR
jgi:hypothetical protein